jgi:hypothetical protein
LEVGSPGFVAYDAMQESVFDRVEGLLKQHGIAFRVLRHEPVYTSEEAARVRGTPLASGAKQLRDLSQLQQEVCQCLMTIKP